ncbi:MAG: hypothetical protein K940chlam5_01150 [Candidatus Anoxychlamydiales bacterium]|nr:hypothetical protein [Candidatus Anoxychlamydiales bacterium]
MEDKQIEVLREILEDFNKERNSELGKEKNDLASLMDGFAEMIDSFLLQFNEHESVIEKMKKYLFNKVESYFLQRYIEKSELIDISNVDRFLENLSVIFERDFGIDDFEW